MEQQARRKQESGGQTDHTGHGQIWQKIGPIDKYENISLVDKT